MIAVQFDLPILVSKLILQELLNRAAFLIILTFFSSTPYASFFLFWFHICLSVFVQLVTLWRESNQGNVLSSSCHPTEDRSVQRCWRRRKTVKSPKSVQVSGKRHRSHDAFVRLRLHIVFGWFHVFFTQMNAFRGPKIIQLALFYSFPAVNKSHESSELNNEFCVAY